MKKYIEMGNLTLCVVAQDGNIDVTVVNKRSRGRYVTSRYLMQLTTRGLATYACGVPTTNEDGQPSTLANNEGRLKVTEY